jgi:hypothetical protein
MTKPKEDTAARLVRLMETYRKLVESPEYEDFLRPLRDYQKQAAARWGKRKEA